MTFFNIEKVKRKLGRRSGGERRFFSYAVVFPERRVKERRTENRRKMV